MLKTSRILIASAHNSYIQHMAGHVDKVGLIAPWVVKSQDTDKVLCSFSSREAACKALQEMLNINDKP